MSKPFTNEDALPRARELLEFFRLHPTGTHFLVEKQLSGYELCAPEMIELLTSLIESAERELELKKALKKISDIEKKTDWLDKVGEPDAYGGARARDISRETLTKLYRESK